MEQVAIYCRVSTEDQAERGTIENQVIFGNKYCDLHGFSIYKVYRDEGISGIIPLDDRPEGKQLINDLKQGKFDTILVYKLDRLGRSARITLNSIHQLESLNAQIRSMTEPFDTACPSGRFMITMLAGVADLERETILERMWYGTNKAANEGKWLGGIVPYGYYVNEKGFLEINNNLIENTSMTEPDVIKLIFNLMSVKKMTSLKIADYLNGLNIPTSYAKSNRKITKGKRQIQTANIWRPNTVQRIIKNKTYIGIHEYGKRGRKIKEVITRTVPSIVDTNTFNKANLILQNNKILSNRSSTRDFLLRKLIYCGECGMSYTGVNYESNGRKAYYKCNGKTAYKSPGQQKCKSKNIEAKYIEDLVWGDIVEFIKNPGPILDEIKKNLNDITENSISIIREIEITSNLIKQKESEKHNIITLFRKGLIDEADVEVQLSELKKELDKLITIVNNLKSEIEDKDENFYELTAIDQLLRNLQETIKGEIEFSKKLEIVRTLVKRITVYTVNDGSVNKTANIHIVYTFKNYKKQNVKLINHRDKDSKLLLA